MNALTNLLDDLQRISERDLDPVFHAHDAGRRVLETDLDRAGWQTLLAAFASTESSVVSAGLSWAIAKEVDREDSILEAHDLFLYLEACPVDVRISRNNLLSAVQLWLMRASTAEMDHRMILNVLAFIKRAVKETEDFTSREIALDILHSLAFDLSEAQRALPAELRTQIIRLLDEEMLGLDDMYEEQRQEALDWVRQVPEA